MKAYGVNYNDDVLRDSRTVLAASHTASGEILFDSCGCSNALIDR